MAENQIATLESLGFDPSDGDMGFEGVSAKCKKMAFLKIAQSGSPEFKDPAKKIKGLEMAQYYCPQTKRIFGTTMRVVIVKFWPAYSVYEGEGPDSKFKGNITEAEFESKVRVNCDFTNKGQVDRTTGLRYIDTRNFLVLPYDSPEDGLLIYSMYSTAIAASKDWVMGFTNYRIPAMIGDEKKLVQVPVYGGVWKLVEPTYVPDNGGYYRANAPVCDGLVDPKYLGGKAKQFYLENKGVDATKFVEADEASEEHSTVKAAHDAMKSANAGVQNAGKVFGKPSAPIEQHADDDQPLF